MPRRGWIATGLFAVMCFAGITTLVSQAGYSGALEQDLRGPRTSLDPNETSGNALGEFATEGLRRGAEIQSGVADSTTPEPGQVLRLR